MRWFDVCGVLIFNLVQVRGGKVSFAQAYVFREELSQERFCRIEVLGRMGGSFGCFGTVYFLFCQCFVFRVVRFFWQGVRGQWKEEIEISYFKIQDYEEEGFGNCCFLFLLKNIFTLILVYRQEVRVFVDCSKDV